MTSATQESRSEKGLARVAQSLASWTEKWFPDAYVFALVGVVLVASPRWPTVHLRERS